MNIEQRLAEAIRSFGLDALAGAVPLNIDLDVVLSVLTHWTALRRRIPGYATATPDTLQRRFLTTGGTIENRDNETIVRLDRRAYSPVLRAKPTCPPPKSPGGAGDASATTTNNQTRVESAERESALTSARSFGATLILTDF